MALARVNVANAAIEACPAVACDLGWCLQPARPKASVPAAASVVPHEAGVADPDSLLPLAAAPLGAFRLLRRREALPHLRHVGGRSHS
jgi:hypothetical protein